jgi:hypothetical protein
MLACLLVMFVAIQMAWVAFSKQVGQQKLVLKKRFLTLDIFG